MVKYTNSEHEKIAIKIPDGIFQVIKICFATWVGNEFKGDIINRLKNSYGFKENQFQYSKFENLVKYKDLCSYCKHQHYQGR